MEDSLSTNPSFINPLSYYINCITNLQERCQTLERKLELVDFHQLMLNALALVSPLEIDENKQSTPLVDEVKKLSEDEWNYLKIRIFFHRKEMLYPLKQDLCLLIFE